MKITVKKLREMYAAENGNLFSAFQLGIMNIINDTEGIYNDDDEVEIEDGYTEIHVRVVKKNEDVDKATEISDEEMVATTTNDEFDDLIFAALEELADEGNDY